MITLNPLLNRVRVKNIGRVNRFTINPEWDNYYLKIQVTWEEFSFLINNIYDNPEPLVK